MAVLIVLLFMLALVCSLFAAFGTGFRRVHLGWLAFACVAAVLLIQAAQKL